MTAPPRTLERADREFDWTTGRELERRDAEIAWLNATLDAQSQLLAEARGAAEQALDDMGADGHCVCEYTKQQLSSVHAKLTAASGEG